MIQSSETRRGGEVLSYISNPVDAVLFNKSLPWRWISDRGAYFVLRITCTHHQVFHFRCTFLPEPVWMQIISKYRERIKWIDAQRIPSACNKEIDKKARMRNNQGDNHLTTLPNMYAVSQSFPVDSSLCLNLPQSTAKSKNIVNVFLKVKLEHSKPWTPALHLSTRHLQSNW